MKCPYCSHPESKVNDTRPTDEGESIRRRRECLACGKRFTTYENIESIPFVVIKRDGVRETFDRGKLIRGILRACVKRPTNMPQLEQLVSDIEQEIQNSLDREVTTEQIGNLVLQKLKALDEVAYVRFASVYHHFEDISGFSDALKKLQSEK